MLKIAKMDPPTARRIITNMPEEALFTDKVLNYVLLEGCMGGVNEEAFYEQYRNILHQRGPGLIRFFAEKFQLLDIRMDMAQVLEESDWNRWKILADCNIPTDPEKCEQYLQRALQLAPEQYHPILWVIKAKNILLNAMENRFEEAEELCRKGLSKQPKSNFHFSLKLLYVLVILRAEPEMILTEIQKLAAEYPFVKHALIPFLQSEFCLSFLSKEKQERLLALKFIDVFPS